MSVSLNGTSYPLPNPSDTDWAAQLLNFFAAIATAVSGVFTWAEASFGALAGTYYLGLGAAAASTSNEYKVRVPATGKLRNLYALAGVAPSGGTAAVTVRVNGADTAITCTVADGGTTAQDTTHSVNVNAGDQVSIKVVCSAGTPPQRFTVTLALTPA